MQVLSPEMKAFLTVGAREEAVWEPRYHYQTYASAGFTILSFFGATVGSAAGGLRDTNMEKFNAIGNPKRFSVEAICVDFVPGVNPSQQVGNVTALQTFANDMFIASSAGALQFRSIDKTYMNVAPLWSVPPGQGLAGGVAIAIIAAQQNSIATPSIGVPSLLGIRWLKSPIPLQAETPFFVDITYTAAAAISANARMGVKLEGLLIRPLQ